MIGLGGGKVPVIRDLNIAKSENKTEGQVGSWSQEIHPYRSRSSSVSVSVNPLFSEADLDEWDAAIADYEAKHPKPREYPIGTVDMYGPDDKTTTKMP